MAVLRPFPCLRPIPELAAQVASVPYDVVDAAEAKALAAGNSESFLHVVRSEIDLPEETDPYSAPVYELASRNLERLVQKGTLIEDRCAAYYLYRLKMGEHTQTGIVACSAVSDYDTGVIRIHEQTRQDKEDDRVRHLLKTRTHAEPVFLTFRSTPKLNDILRQVAGTKPLYDFVAPDGIAHTVWKISDTAEISSSEITRLFEAVPCTYVADGHHRAKSASRACAELLAKNPDLPPDHPARFFLTVLFPQDQLRIMPYNRVIKKSVLSPAAIRERSAQNFILSATPPPLKAPRQCGEFVMLLAGQWWTLKLRPEIVPSNDPVESLDVSILQRYLLEPVFGIQDPRTDQSLGFVGGIRGIGELERLVNSGAAQLALALYPVPMEAFLRVAEAGKLMPPKSTWFEPKLRSGLLVHRF